MDFEKTNEANVDGKISCFDRKALGKMRISFALYPGILPPASAASATCIISGVVIITWKAHILERFVGQSHTSSRRTPDISC